MPKRLTQFSLLIFCLGRLLFARQGEVDRRHRARYGAHLDGGPGRALLRPPAVGVQAAGNLTTRQAPRLQVPDDADGLLLAGVSK